MANNNVTPLRRESSYERESWVELDSAPSGAEMIVAYALASFSGSVVTLAGCWLYWRLLGAACG